MALEKPGKPGEFFSPTLWPPWQVYKGRMPLLSPNQQRQNTKEKLKQINYL